jgi:amino acid adenylation domain-containing protein
MHNENNTHTSPEEDSQTGEIREWYAALTPMQQGMLYMSLSSPPEAGYYVEQVLCAIAHPLDQGAFIEAWRRVYRQYPVLSTAFSWEGQTEVRQALHPTAELPIHTETWPAEGDVEARLREWLIRDRRKGFRLDRPPLTRLTLIALADGSHRCVWTIHHAIADGRAMAFVLQCVFRAYDALCRGDEVHLPAVAPFLDYAKTFEAAPPAGAQPFWEAQLGDFAEALELPLPAPPEETGGPTPGFASVERRLAPEVRTALDGLAAATGTTLGTLVQTAWALLLHRYTGSEDIVFGATKSVRHGLHDGAEALGLYINTLPFRVTIAGAAPVEALVRDVRERWCALRPHEHTPLSRIQAWSAAPGGTPLFHSVLVFERDTLDGLVKSNGGNWAGREFTLHECTPNPLTVAVYAQPRMLLTAEYDSARYDEASMARMLGHLETLLRGMAESPGQLPALLPLLTPEEHDQLFRAWQPRAWRTRFDSVVSRFAWAAAGRPHHPALEHEGQAMTYAELDMRSRAVAGHLASLGVCPGAHVGLCVPRSFDLIVGLLGVLRAGGAYVPIDPGYPEERMRFIAADAGIEIMLTVQSLHPKWEGKVATVVCLDTPGPAVHAAHEIAGVAAPGDVAYVIYTSGSTGQPKGVLVHHEALAAFVHGATATYGVDSTGRMLQFASPSFDAAVEEIFLALCNGMTLVLRTEAMLATADRFFEACNETGVTILDLPTAFWHVLVDGLGTAPFPPRVHTVIIGGEAARAGQVARWKEYVPETVQLLNTYGPTETTVVATCAGLHLLPDVDVPIGRPLPGATAHVLDPHQQPVPVGLPGELCVGGPQVALGYHGRDELTQERFIASPFREGERLYRTGDKVCWRPDGQLVYLGRFDRQVKLRGYRIELDGIESVLRELPAVRDAAVKVVELAEGQQLLAAYVAPVAAADLESVAGDARKWATERLPDYMRPAVCVPMDKLPMLPSGKVDYRSLPAPQMEAGLFLAPPETPEEERLAALWMDVLRLPAVSCEDDFFDLGGHSLLAVQLAARIRQVFQVDVSLQDIFTLSTVRKLARHIGQQPKLAATAGPMQPAPRQGVAPLTFDQQILWLFEQVYPGTQSYLIPVAFRLRGPLRVELLEQALTEIVARHESLRTVFRLQGDSPAQWVKPAGPFGLTKHILPFSPVDEREIRRWLSLQACKPIDIEEGPPFRGDLLAAAPEDHVLCLVMHHLVADGWSVGVLVREMNLLYGALAAGQASQLTPLPLQFGDYAHWQRSHFDAASSPAVAYWTKQLASPPQRITWPPLLHDAGTDPRQGAQYPIRIDRDSVSRLAAAGKERGTSLFMKLLALFGVLIERYAGAPDLLAGVVSANRGRLELEPLVGFFISTLPVRICPGEANTFAALLTQVKRAVLDAQTHQDIPFETLRRITRETDDAPFLQTLFLMQTMDIPQLELPGVTSQTLNIDMGKALTDLTLELYETDDGLAGWFEYSTSYFSRDSVARLAVLYQRLIDAAAAMPDLPLDRLPHYEAVRTPLLDSAPEVWVVPPAPRRLVAARGAQPAGTGERPRGEIEEQMAGLWQEVLRVPVIHRHDNFFRIGGHSLLAIILLQQIERRFRKRLAPVHIYQAPTVAALSKLLQRAGEEPRRALHTIQPDGARMPLFFVGSTDLLPAIQGAFGNDHPLHSLNIFGLQKRDGGSPFSSLEDVAALFIEEMRACQPEGPYALGGYCRDTMVAFEMARQLRAAGQEVAHLALVDVYWDTMHTYSTWYRHLRNVMRMGPAYLAEKWGRRLKFLREQFNRRRSRRAAKISQVRGDGLPHDHRNTLFINDYYDAVVAYEPKPYEGKVSIYMASEWGLTDVPGWKNLAAGGAEILVFDACHFNIWRSPQAERLGTLLRAELDKVSTTAAEKPQ